MDLNLSGSQDKEALMRQINGKEIDGIHATKKIFDIDHHAQIIGFTAYAHTDWGEQFRATGVQEVIGREIGFEGFAQLVKTFFT